MLQELVPFFLRSLSFCMGPEQSILSFLLKPDGDAKVLLKSKMRQRRQQVGA